MKLPLPIRSIVNPRPFAFRSRASHSASRPSKMASSSSTGRAASFKTLFAAGPAKLPIINVERRFELLGRTGQGSMSKVFKARDRQTGRLVCLKLLDREKTIKFEARFVGLKKPSEGEISTMMRH